MADSRELGNYSGTDGATVQGLGRETSPNTLPLRARRGRVLGEGEVPLNGVASTTAALRPARFGRWLRVQPLASIALVTLIVVIALIIGVLPATYAVILVVGLAVVILTTIRIDVGLWLLAFAVPFGSVRPIAVGQLNLTASEFLVALVLAAWLARGLARRQLRISLSSGLLSPLLAFFAILLLATTAAWSIDACYKEILRWLELIVVYVVVSDHVRSTRQVCYLAVMILLAASAEALIGFYQFFTQTGPESYIVGPFLRAYGTFSQPNPFAGYLGLVLPIAISLALGALFRQVMTTHRPASVQSPGGGTSPSHDHGNGVIMGYELPRPVVLLAWGAGGLVALAMLMSLSRGAMLGVAAAVAVMATLASRRTLGAMLIGLLVLSLVLLLGAFNVLPQQLTMRLSQVVQYFGVFDVRQVELTSQNWAIVERMARWQSAWDMFVNNPLLGVGPGNYAVAYKTYALPGWSDPLGHAHNFYLNMMAETGVLGAGAYLSLVGIWFWHGVRVVRRAGGTARVMALGLVGVLTAAAVHNFFDNLYVHDMNVQAGLTLGLLTAIGASAKSAESRGTG